MYLVTAELASVSGLAKDSVVNTFAFGAPQAESEANVNLLLDAVEGFYNDDRSGAVSSLGNILGGSITRTALAHTLRAYFLTGAQLQGAKKSQPETYAGSPVVERAWTLDADGSVAPSLPQEVALCLTLEGLNRSEQPVEGVGGIRPRARRTGRIYLGPFDADQLSSSTDPRPAVSTVTRILDAGEALYDESAALGMGWAVWSRANAAVYELEAISVANDWDTQRRRGSAPTARTRRAVTV